MTLERRLSRLSGCHPELVARAKATVRLMEQRGYRLVVTEGKRSLARQRELYAQGRTKPGPIVTWTMFSNHLSGRAADLAFLDKKNRVSWSESYPWSTMGRDAKHFGLQWGGDWKKKDKPHVEWKG